MTTTIRCSSLDYLHHCVPSVLNGALLRVSPYHEAAEVGSAVHEILASHVNGEVLSVAAACARHGLSPGCEEEVGKLAEAGRNAWESLSRYFIDPSTEVAVESENVAADAPGGPYKISGTVDVISPVGKNKAVAVDWKTGWLDRGYQHQMAGYAHCIWNVLGRPEDTEITTITVFLRRGYHRVVRWSPERLRQWIDELERNVLAHPERFRPGEHCRYCEVRAECPARRVMVQSTIEALIPRVEDGEAEADWVAAARSILGDMDEDGKRDPRAAEAVEKIRSRARMAKQAAKEVEDIIKEAVGRLDGLPLPNNRELVMQQVDHREVKAGMAMRPLRALMSDRDICRSMKLSLTQLKDIYVEKAEKGQKRQLQAELVAKLEEAGAIRHEPRERLTEIDVPETKESEDE